MINKQKTKSAHKLSYTVISFLLIIIVGYVFVRMIYKSGKELESVIEREEDSIENMAIKQNKYLNMVANKNSGPRETISDSQSKVGVDATWYQVKTWSGSGVKNTEPFTIIGNQWRVNWKYKGIDAYGSGMLEIYIYKSNGDLEGVSASTIEVGGDTSYFYNKGTFYLTINSTGKWEVEVEELK